MIKVTLGKSAFCIGVPEMKSQWCFLFQLSAYPRRQQMVAQECGLLLFSWWTWIELVDHGFGPAQPQLFNQSGGWEITVCLLSSVSLPYKSVKNQSINRLKHAMNDWILNYYFCGFGKCKYLCYLNLYCCIKNYGHRGSSFLHSYSQEIPHGHPQAILS